MRSELQQSDLRVVAGKKLGKAGEGLPRRPDQVRHVRSRIVVVDARAKLESVFIFGQEEVIVRRVNDLTVGFGGDKGTRAGDTTAWVDATELLAQDESWRKREGSSGRAAEVAGRNADHVRLTEILAVFRSVGEKT